MQATLLWVAVVLLIAWLFIRQRGRSAEEEQPTALEDTGSTAYHAVSIKFDNNACEAAKAMEGRRFLSSAAPRLPLPECNALECRCHFHHHEDRRSRKDRRSPFGAAGFAGGSGSYEKERRERPDRRKSDDDLDDYNR